jgi:hypothetical protein
MHGLKADFEKPVQLTGLSDPIFAEALITIEQFDLTLLILVVNQTRDTLHNLCLELFTVGALKVSERPEQYTLAPEGFITIKVGIKLSSSDGGTHIWPPCVRCQVVGMRILPSLLQANRIPLTVRQRDNHHLLCGAERYLCGRHRLHPTFYVHRRGISSHVGRL